MRLLLDSHVVLWAMTWPERLRESTRQAIISPRNDVFISAASLWELNLKVAKGKLVLPDDFVETLARQNFNELPVRWDHTQSMPQLPAIHTDPFDRLLLAQAHTDGLTFVTSDRFCLQYPVPLIEA
jgi:PIN domain nuclease of toxin-antitoxin system